jgi:hypothetical protein
VDPAVSGGRDDDSEPARGRSALPAPVAVPLHELAPDTLTALIESFVAREGTDYGAVERSFAAKVADVRRQLERGEASIEFDPETESATIVSAQPPRRRRD